MATMTTGSRGLAVELTPVERVQFARRLGEAMSALGYDVAAAARETQLTPGAVRARLRDDGKRPANKVTLWSLGCLCGGLELDLREIITEWGLELTDDEVERANKAFHDRRKRAGMPTTKVPGRRTVEPAVAGNGNGGLTIGPALREAIEAIVDERVERRLAELLSV